MCKTFTICECPPSISYEDLPVKPCSRTPLDKFGFPQKCCWCFSLKCAAVLICMLSFLWGGYELQSADMFMASLFQTRSGAFYYCKIFYLLWLILLLLACGFLMLGIIVERFQLVNLYVWFMFVFCCAYFLIIMGCSIITVLNTGSVSKKATMRLIGSVLWTSMFIYFVMVVNSYKLSLWYKQLGF